MDMGANGILAPQVDSYEEAVGLVEAIKFPPIGRRGFCPITRSASYGHSLDPADYAAMSNENTIVGIMIESRAGVEDLDRILTIEELDFVAVGPSDLSCSYGLLGQYDNTVFQEVLDTTFKKLVRSHVSVGGIAYSREQAVQQFKTGVNMLNVGSDLQLIMARLEEHVKTIRSITK